MTRMKSSLLLVLLAGAAFAACSDDTVGPGDDDDVPVDPGTNGGSGNTFDHDNSSTIDPWELLARLQEEGPASYTSRVHSCPKVRFATLKNLLASRGVVIDGSTNGVTPSALYNSGFNAMGGPNYNNRIRENTEVTTSALSRMFDIYAAAAPEIITAIATAPQCQVDGIGQALFDGNNCNVDAVSCLIGLPATAGHIDLCNLTVAQASTPDVGKRLAVAALLAAAHTCE